MNDVSFTSIDAALSESGSSFISALNSMRIANRIMSNHQNAEPYTYAEAQQYPVTSPYEISSLIFNNNSPITYEQNSLKLYASNYIEWKYHLHQGFLIENTDGPNSDLFCSIIFKYQMKISGP